MSFLEAIERAKAFLEPNLRISVRSLQREFDVGDDAVGELVEELVEIQRVALREREALTWLASAPSQAPPGEANSPCRADAERRQLTVMFCDLVGSTRLSERLDPDDMRDVVRAYKEAAAQVLDFYEGYLAQYLGDGVLVYFGYPGARARRRAPGSRRPRPGRGATEPAAQQRLQKSRRGAFLPCGPAGTSGDG